MLPTEGTFISTVNYLSFNHSTRAVGSVMCKTGLSFGG